MSKKIETEILILAKPEKVWAIPTDFDKYPDWNPFIKSIQGNVRIGNTITVRLEPPGANGMTFKPVVLAFDINKELRWIGHLLFPGLFDGEHQFELINNNNGTTTFRQSENFRGILVPLFNKMLDINTVNGFNLMNRKLKELVENEL
ncbi:MAG: SRPBCC domain-containing protein [Bacteroidales bacterium]|nr:SRPBCC domain-containing protein [Bacteroidales bacterium]